MNLLQQFKENIRHNNLFHSGDHLLLAVSGGIDSVVLCELCSQAGYSFTIAHCNFQLRGEESERDQEFVKKLAEKYNAELFLQKFETASYAKEKKLSIQVAARELRYGWFNELLDAKEKKEAPVKVLTAHHLNDNIETLMMNFFKGTGVAGLRGMLPEQGRIVRPLLFATKEELLRFAKESNLDWVQDSSNESDKYSRNYLRHNIIPLVQKIFPEAEHNLAANVQRFREIEILYQQSIDRHKKNLVTQKGNEFYIPILKLKKTEPVRSIVFEIIKSFGFHPAQVDDVMTLLNSGTGKYVASATHRVIRNRNWLVIAPLATVEASTILVTEGNENIEFTPARDRRSRLQLETYPIRVPASDGYQPLREKNIAEVDFGKIKFPLILRKWKTGDYFYPLGMKDRKGSRPGKKKLSRFFIDQKLSTTDKERVWVLEMDKKIIWVIGHRIDDRYKITDNTKQVLKLSFSQT